MESRQRPTEGAAATPSSPTAGGSAPGSAIPAGLTPLRVAPHGTPEDRTIVGAAPVLSPSLPAQSARGPEQAQTLPATRLPENATQYRTDYQRPPAQVREPAMAAAVMAQAPQGLPSSAPLQSSPPRAGSRSVGVAIGVSATLLLIGGGVLFWGMNPGVRAPAAPSVSRTVTTDTSGPPPAQLANSMQNQLGEQVLLEMCLRDGTQTINSTVRDRLLLDAIHAYDTGNRAGAHALLKKYVREACDRATFEALSILDAEIGRKVKEL